jgi:VCBS repeat-containing protein
MLGVGAGARIGARLFFSVLIGLSSGCGGGGGDDPPPPPAPPANRAPQMTAIALALDEDDALTHAIAATDPDGDALTFAKGTDVQHGTLTIASNGSATYTPAPNYNGSDSFSATVSDGRGGTASASFAITVRPVNDAPVAQNDELRIGAGNQPIALLENDSDLDGDVLTITVLSQPRGGTVAVSNAGAVTFAPENEFAGPTSFDYRISDAAGVTADARANLVAGNFPGLVFLSDQQTLGIHELQFYDGFRVVRVNAPLGAGLGVGSYTIAADGRHVAYVVAQTAAQEVFLADLTQPGVAKSVYTSAADPQQPESLVHVTLNRDGTYAVIRDPAYSSALKTVLVRTADAVASGIGPPNLAVTNPGTPIFNPVTDELYFQATVIDPVAPFPNNGFTALFATTLSAPATLAQLTPDYAWQGGGHGSGFFPSVSADGKRVVYSSVTFFPRNGDVWVDNRDTNSATFVYRDFGPNEFALQSRFAVNAQGTGVCIQLDSTNGNPPRQIWYADPASPGSAFALSPAVHAGIDCRFASDGKTIIYQSTNTYPLEPWLVHPDQPGSASRLREPLTSQQSMMQFEVAKKAMTAVIGVWTSGGSTVDLYRVALDSPGQNVKFASGNFMWGSLGSFELDAWGATVAYTRKISSPFLGDIGELHLLSSRISDYDVTIGRPDSKNGVTQVQFVPAP